MNDDDVFELLLADLGTTSILSDDLKARNALGWLTHGGPMFVHNMRDPIREAYEEALDLVVYLRQSLARTHSSSIEYAFKKALQLAEFLKIELESDGGNVADR